MKTFLLRTFLLLAAWSVQAADPAPTTAVYVDASGNPTTVLNLGGSKFTGTVPFARLPFTLGTVPYSVPQVGGNGKLDAAIVPLPNSTGTTFGSLTLSYAGPETTQLVRNSPSMQRTVNVEAGSAAHTKTLRLMRAGVVTGDRLLLVIALPASTNPTLVISDEYNGQIYTITGTGKALRLVVPCVYNGGFWATEYGGALALLTDTAGNLATALNLGAPNVTGTLNAERLPEDITFESVTTGNGTLASPAVKVGEGGGFYASSGLAMTNGSGDVVRLHGGVLDVGLNVLGFSSDSYTTTAGLSSPTPGTLAVGNGTPGDASGAMQATYFRAGGYVVAQGSLRVADAGGFYSDGAGGLRLRNADESGLTNLTVSNLIASGVRLTSPNGSHWRVTIGNDGVLTTAPLP